MLHGLRQQQAVLAPGLRQFATGGVACVDLFLLRPSLANRVTMAALGGFNRAVAGMKGLVRRAGLEKHAKKVRRGS